MNLRIVITLFLVAIAGFSSNSYAQSANKPEITIASKKFTESVILAEILTQLVRSKGYKTIHKQELGGTRVLWNALIAGEIDAYVEYTGTLKFEMFAGQDVHTDDRLNQALARHGLQKTAPLGFNNTYAIGTSSELSKTLSLESISDLKRHPKLIFGFGNEFMDRADGWPGLQQRYQLPQQDVRGLDHDLAYRGLASKALDIINLYTTDAEIAYYQIKVLKDDLDYFPEYQAIVIYRSDLKQRANNAASALHLISGNIDESQMLTMNARVKLARESESQVASDYLKTALDLNSEFETLSLWQQFIIYSYEHLILVAVSLSTAILFAIPLGIVAARRPKAGHFILATTSIIQTIPSLALFVFMIPLLGIGGPPAIIALFLYSLLPIVRNTHAGLSNIAVEIQESATVIGLSKFARLRLIELPLSMPSILAGIKTSAVINIGTATLAALIGAGGYGQPILTGIRLDDTQLILLGAIPSAVLALLVQSLFELIERQLLPKGLRRSGTAQN